MTTKKRNTPKKAAAKRRTVSEKPIDALARNITGALGRKLDDLLDAQASRSIHPVHALTTVELGSIDANQSPMWRNAIKNDAAESAPKPRSAIDEAIGRLFSAICAAECVTDSMQERLDPVLSDPLPATASAPLGQDHGGTSRSAKMFNELADRIYADNRRRLALLDRLEL
jgi:hypothetical protein